MFQTRCLLTGICAVLPIFATTAYANELITNIPATELAWETTPEGVAFAALKGDRFHEAYMAMVRLPAGLVSPAHTKTASMHGVVVSGVISHRAVDSEPTSEKHLPVGSYYEIPANVPHVSKCLSQTDCITFLYQDGSFDFLPTDQ